MPTEPTPAYPQLLPYQQRVVLEHEDLVAAIQRLEAFLATEAFKTVDPAEQGRLTQQHQCMKTYASILNDRITHFKHHKQ